MNDLHNTNDSHLESEFQDFFEHTRTGFLIVDSSNTISKSNTRFASWMEVTFDEIKGRKFSDLLSIGSKIYYETHLSPLLRMQGFFEEVLLELTSSSGTRLKVLVNALQYKNKDGIVEAINYTLVKATDRIQYEQNLQYAKTEAERKLESEKANVLLREQLIAVLGHDLRNPLGAITMAVNLLQDSLDNPTQEELVTIIKRSSFRMSELITNIMDFARTRLGEGIVIIPKDVNLQPVLQHVIDELKLVFPDREIIAEFDVIEPFSCDADRIAQLLSNLLANALTHGYVETPVYVKASHSDKILKISVINNGDPIPDTSRGLLFEPFTKEGNRRSKNGLGLGLYISSEIARAHNGTLTFSSTESETQFIFSLSV